MSTSPENILYEDHQIQHFLEKVDAEQQTFIKLHLETLKRIFSCSPWIAQRCQTHPQWIIEDWQAGKFDQVYTPSIYTNQLSQIQAVDFSQLSKQLRLWRQREMIRIIWRMSLNVSSLAETLADLSALADSAIHFAEQKIFFNLSEKYGTPKDESGEPQHLVVIALGKLGGEELNLSSDIDLLFGYSQEGMLEKSGLSYDEFYQRLAQQFIKLLHEITADGFVFRVDMRLRPYGESGPLVMSFTGLENYYQAQGREWERYALIKARPVTGSAHDQKEFSGLIRPFVYRRYVDYSVLQSLREMHGMIQQEVQKKGMHDHVKLGEGGIRSLEFIVQMHQLIRGGRETRLQQKNFFAALTHLQEDKLLTDSAAKELKAAYIFLRLTEHALQAVNDQQTHTLPQHTLEQVRLAYALNFADWHDFLHELNRHRQIVAHYFAEYSTPPSLTGLPQEAAPISAMAKIWLGQIEEVEALALLEQNGFAEPKPIYELLREYAELPACRKLSPQSNQRILAFLPALLVKVSAVSEPVVTLTRTLDIMLAVVKRSAYLVLLTEKPLALKRFVDLCSASSWISQELVRHPALLDELLGEYDGNFNRPKLFANLQQALIKIDPNDTESQMDTLRYMKRVNFLRVAVAELNGTLNVSQASRKLTRVAEVIVDTALVLVWRQQLAKSKNSALKEIHLMRELAELKHIPFAILAYGKFASKELSYTSDLDLVFLYQNLNTDQSEDELYLRIAQRMMHWLNTPTHMGVLFRVDTQLQPEGSAGLLVSEWQRFAEYQQTQAWIWEQQAMVRARIIHAPLALRRLFRQMRRKVLRQPRVQDVLQHEILGMRQRMQHYKKRRGAGFDLKNDPGGMIDIEFIIQFVVLYWAAQYGILTRYMDTARLCSTAEEVGALTPEQATFLRLAYLTYRERSHRLALQNLLPMVPANEYDDLRTKVREIWEKLLNNI